MSARAGKGGSSHRFPELVVDYPADTQYVDRLIQLPLQFVAVFWIILQFSRAYDDVVAELRADLPVERSVALADQALYRAKQRGRNRVETAPVQSP